MKIKNENYLVEGSVGMGIFRFAFPIFIGNLLQQLFQIFDTVIVGNFLGKDALGSVGASFPIIFAMSALVIGFTNGGAIVVAQIFGTGNIEKLRRAADTILITIIGAGVILGIAGFFCSGLIIDLIGLPEKLVPNAELYLHVMFLGFFTTFGYFGVASILRGVGDSKTPLYFLVFAVILNIGLNLLFILVFKWGVFGSAFATVISQGASFIATLIYLKKKHPIIKLTFDIRSFDKFAFKESLRIGLPSGLQQVAVALGNIILFSVVNSFGTDVIAAFSVCVRLDMLCNMPLMNIGSAFAIFVGQNFGAKKEIRIKKGLRFTLILNLSISLFFMMLMFLLGHDIVGMFVQDPVVVSIGVEYMRIVSSFYFLFATMLTFNGVYKGYGNMIIPFLFTVVSLWLVRIPTAVFLSSHWGVDGIWWAIPMGWAVGCICAVTYYFTGLWKRRVKV